MSKSILNKHIQKTLEWINQTDNLLGWNHKAYAFDALRAVLHQLRDHLSIIEAVHLGAQLPLIIRGMYFENWKPSQVPLKQRHKTMFIESVRNTLEQYIRRSFEDENIDHIIRSVFQTLASRIDEGESVKLIKILPAHLKGFIAETIVKV